MLKVKSKNAEESCELCSKLTKKTPERCLMTLLLSTLKHIILFSSNSIVTFELVNVSWASLSLVENLFLLRNLFPNPEHSYIFFTISPRLFHHYD